MNSQVSEHFEGLLMVSFQPVWGCRNVKNITWTLATALFVDLVKAFDTVPRKALFAVLRRFGLPDHFVNVIIRLHKNAIIKVKVGAVDSELESSTGVRQGSCEGPVLFLFIMQAALEIMNWPVAKPGFRTCENGVTMGERTGRKRGATTFEHWCSLFADDCALFFDSRADLEIGASYLVNHFVSLAFRCMLEVAQHLRRPKHCTFRRPGSFTQMQTPRAWTSSIPREYLSASSILRLNSNTLVQ